MADTQRERLIKLIRESVKGCSMYWSRCIADYLLDNGVIVPPCKVGDTVYFLTGIRRNIIKSAKVKEIIFDENGIRDLFVQADPNHMFENSFYIFFLTIEDAERALREYEE